MHTGLQKDALILYWGVLVVLIRNQHFSEFFEKNMKYFENQKLINNLQIEIMCHDKEDVEFTDGREALKTSYHFKIKKKNSNLNNYKFKAYLKKM